MTNNSPFPIVAVNDTVEVLDVESADTQRGHFASDALSDHLITSVQKTQPTSISPRSALKPPSAPFAPSSIKWPSGSSTQTTSIVTGTSCAMTMW